MLLLLEWRILVIEVRSVLYDLYLIFSYHLFAFQDILLLLREDVDIAEAEHAEARRKFIVGYIIFAILSKQSWVMLYYCCDYSRF